MIYDKVYPENIYISSTTCSLPVAHVVGAMPFVRKGWDISMSALSGASVFHTNKMKLCDFSIGDEINDLVYRMAKWE